VLIMDRYSAADKICTRTLSHVHLLYKFLSDLSNPHIAKARLLISYVLS